MTSERSQKLDDRYPLGSSPMVAQALIFNDSSKRSRPKAIIFPCPNIDDSIELMRTARRKGYICLAVFDTWWRAFAAYDEFPEMRSSRFVAESAVALSDQELEQRLRSFSERFEICGILPRTEISVDLAIRIQSHVKLPHLPTAEAMARFRNKYALKSHLRGAVASILICESRLVSSVADIEIAVSELSQRRGSVPAFVLKPNDGAGNRGIGFFMDGLRPNEAARQLKESGGTLLFEEFVDGVEYCVNGQADSKGEIHIVNISRYEREHANGRRNVYHYQWHVPRSAPEYVTIAQGIKEALEVAGLRGLPFHAECFVNEQGIWLNEIAARHGGGHSADIMRKLHANRFAALDIAVECAAGEASTEMQFDWETYDTMKYLVIDGISHQDGIIRHLHGIDAIEAAAEFVRWDVKPELGKRIEKTTHLLSAPYGFHLSSSSEESLRQAAIRLEQHLKLTICDSWKCKLVERAKKAAMSVRFRAFLLKRRITGRAVRFMH